MNRAPLKYSAVLAGAFFLVLEVATGLILWIAVSGGQGPRFRGRGGGASFLGVDRSTWIDLHDWVGLLLVAAIVVHIGLNWRWVTEQTRLLLAGPGQRPKVAPPQNREP